MHGGAGSLEAAGGRVTASGAEAGGVAVFDAVAGGASEFAGEADEVTAGVASRTLGADAAPAAAHAKGNAIPPRGKALAKMLQGGRDMRSSYRATEGCRPM